MRRTFLDCERTAVWVLAALANLLVITGLATAAEPPTRSYACSDGFCPRHFGKCEEEVDAALLLNDQEERIWNPRLPFYRRDEATLDLGFFRLTIGVSADERPAARPSARQPAVVAGLSEELETPTPAAEPITLAEYTEEGTPLQHTPAEAARDILEIRRRLGPTVRGTLFEEECGAAAQNQQMLQALAEQFRRHAGAAGSEPRRICQPTVHTAGFPVAPLPEHAGWAMPVTSFPPPVMERSDAAMLRDVAEQIEAAANQLERAERYERADQLRHAAAALRADARSLKETRCEHCGANCACQPGKHCGAEGCHGAKAATAARCEHCGTNCACLPGKHCGAEGCRAAATPERTTAKAVSECPRRGPCGGEAGGWIVTSEPKPSVLPPRIVQPQMDALIEAFSVEKAVEKAAESQAEYAELVRELQALSGDLAGHLHRPTLPLTEPEANHLRQTVRRLRQHVRELK